MHKKLGGLIILHRTVFGWMFKSHKFYYFWTGCLRTYSSYISRSVPLDNSKYWSLCASEIRSASVFSRCFSCQTMWLLVSIVILRFSPFPKNLDGNEKRLYVNLRLVIVKVEQCRVLPLRILLSMKNSYHLGTSVKTRALEFWKFKPWWCKIRNLILKTIIEGTYENVSFVVSRLHTTNFLMTLSNLASNAQQQKDFSRLRAGLKVLKAKCILSQFEDIIKTCNQ